MSATEKPTAEPALRRLAARPLHRLAGQVRPGDAVAERRQPQRLRADPAGRVEDCGPGSDAVVAQDRVERPRLAPTLASQSA
jgi:hypothetical protein